MKVGEGVEQLDEQVDLRGQGALPARRAQSAGVLLQVHGEERAAGVVLPVVEAGHHVGVAESCEEEKFPGQEIRRPHRLGARAAVEDARVGVLSDAGLERDDPAMEAVPGAVDGPRGTSPHHPQALVTPGDPRTGIGCRMEEHGTAGTSAPRRGGGVKGGRGRIARHPWRGSPTGSYCTRPPIRTPGHAVDGEAPKDYPTPAPSGISGRARDLELPVSSSPLLSNEVLLAQNVQPKAGTPGVAQDSSPPAAAAGGASSSAPLRASCPS